jgi:hypothetical protein
MKTCWFLPNPATVRIPVLTQVTPHHKPMSLPSLTTARPATYLTIGWLVPVVSLHSLQQLASSCITSQSTAARIHGFGFGTKRGRDSRKMSSMFSTSALIPAAAR